MESGRVSVKADQRSRRLPPLEAWKQPDKWIDVRTGLVKPDAPKLILDTDDRGFLRPDQVVQTVNEVFFWKDYDWPYQMGDPETQPDDHHFYYDEAEYSPGAHSGSYVPMRFRELPTQIGRMPRQFHNTIHDLTAKPEMPELEHMEHYYRSYLIAQQAFKRLYITAKRTAGASQIFPVRRRTIADGNIEPKHHDDEIGEAYMRELFDKHFRSYSRAIEHVRSISDPELIFPDVDSLQKVRLQKVVKKLGQVVTREYINFVPTLRAA